MNACIKPGHEPLEQLALAQHDDRLLAQARGDVAGALDARRLAHAHEPHEQQRAAREQPAGEAERRGEGERAGQHYASRARRSSAVIAGTISLRSPTTA